MSNPRLARRLRWAVPVGVAAAVAAAAALPTAATADEHPALPDRTAAQLLVDLQGAEVHALSGSVVETARLGLPQLPESAGGGSTGPQALATGSHTLKVWYDGAERQRVAMLGQLAEYDAVHNGSDVWTYTSQTNEVTHLALPAEKARPLDSGTLADPRTLTTPQAAAEAVLKAVDPTTVVQVDLTARVADRPAYQLVLKPKDPTSLIGSVRIAIDSEKNVPTRVQVWSTADPRTPALEVGFTDLSFDRPAASVFAFSTPPGAKVTEQGTPAAGAAKDAAPPAGKPAGAAPTVVGTGWGAVVSVAGVDTKGTTGQSAQLLNQLTTRVPEGRLLTTALVSALLTDDGRLLAGAVTPQRLQELAR